MQRCMKRYMQPPQIQIQIQIQNQRRKRLVRARAHPPRKERALQKIGSLTRQIESSLDPSKLSPMPRPQGSAITGTPYLGSEPVKSLGELLGGIGVAGPERFPGVPDEFGEWIALSRGLRYASRASSTPPGFSESLQSHQRRLREPATGRQLALRIEALLAHYWTPETSDEARSMAGSDWVRLLAGKPLWAVDYACLGYLRDCELSRRRPMPADILEKLPIGL